jgi:hypothetical protein
VEMAGGGVIWRGEALSTSVPFLRTLPIPVMPLVELAGLGGRASLGLMQSPWLFPGFVHYILPTKQFGKVIQHLR